MISPGSWVSDITLMRLISALINPERPPLDIHFFSGVKGREPSSMKPPGMLFLLGWQHTVAMQQTRS